VLRKGHILAIVVIGVSVTAFLSISAQQNYDIPAWVKGVAGFWAEDKISDQEFGEGLSFLIDNKIIRVPEMERLEDEVRELNSEVSRLEGELYSAGIVAEYTEKDVDHKAREKLQSSLGRNSETKQIVPLSEKLESGEKTIFEFLGPRGSKQYLKVTADSFEVFLRSPGGGLQIEHEQFKRELTVEWIHLIEGISRIEIENTGDTELQIDAMFQIVKI